MSQKVDLVASFLGLKFLPPPLVIGSNSINPKLIFYEDEVEYRVFLTNRVAYSNIEKVDVFLFYKTTTILLTRYDSVFTFGGNLNDESELVKILTFLQNKGCLLTEKASTFVKTA